MFFFLSKTLFYLLMPLTWIVFCVLFALFTKNEKRKKRALIAAAALLLFFSNPFIVNEAMLLWEKPPTPISTLPNYDAAIILTGITNQDKSPKDRVYVQRGADRFLMPLRLYKEGKIKNIIISGGSGSLTQKKSSEAEEIKKLLVLSGVPQDAILLEDKSRNTHENARFTKNLLLNYPQMKRLLLVTSAFHMRRASACFQKAGLAADIFTTDFYSYDREWGLNELVPKESSLYIWQKLLHEVLGYIVYKIMGYC